MSEKVRIVVYNPNWPEIYKLEKEKIKEKIDEYIASIDHIGSTAIEGLVAKPIVDILIGLNSLDDAQFCIPKLEELNYEYVPEFEDVLPDRRYFRKPPTDQGSRDFHVHMVEIKTYFWKRQLIFRDYLRKFPEVANEYGELKLKLAADLQDDREAYSEGKTDFILGILEKVEKETENDP
ncbi:MAG: GrpB family protein [Candidatus Heimdallarchaeota archaeon]|nr:GrpB family protein [Candidatus Heimdallarchaeota archaeon]